jgi:hypothetical protein
MRKYWTPKETRVLIKIYADTITADLAKQFNCTVKQIYNKAKRLDLSKSEHYLQNYGGRITETNIATQFKKGHKSWNKGLKGLQMGGAQTQFKAGGLPHNTKPIGYRSTRDGYLVEKTDKGFEFVHWLLWRQHHGEIPKGLFVVFKDRNRLNVCIDNLELIDRSENMRRNHIQNLPAELRAVIHIKKQITRKINQHGTKQN